jgi:DNA end-binding protein Ku
MRIVFLHGLLTDHRLWRKVIPELDGIETFAPTLPLGSHEIPMPHADLSPPGLARLVAGMLEDGDLLVGNDTGGAIAQLVAAYHPERLGGLVLTNCDAYERFFPPLFRPLQLAARVPGGVEAIAASLRVPAARRLPIAYGKLAKRPIERAVTDAWAAPSRRAEIRRDLRRVLRGVDARHLFDALPGPARVPALDRRAARRRLPAGEDRVDRGLADVRARGPAGRAGCNSACRDRTFGTIGTMPRSIWSGAISFGLVNVPVKLFSAVSRKTVRFHQLNADTGHRIAQKRVDSVTEEEVPYEKIVKGFELTKERYVVVTPEELDSIAPEKTRAIDIEDFVDLEDIDPIFYDHPYYLVPDKGAGKAYALLLEAMRESGKVAIARVVLRSKEQLVAIRPAAGNVLTMETMIFHDEVVPADDLDEVPEAKDLKTSDRELKMAQQLIDSLSSDFEPSKYHDEYREKVLELIERKADGEEIAIQPQEEEPQKVPDLMAALEASLAAVKDPEAGKQSKSDGKSNGKAKTEKKSSSRAKAGAKK